MKKTITFIAMIMAIFMIIALPIMAETPQTDANSNLPYFISGVVRPKRLQYSFDVKNYGSVGNNGTVYNEESGAIYWPNKLTGLIDSLRYEAIMIQDANTYQKKVRFLVIGTGSQEYPQYYVDILLMNQPYIIKCVGYYETEQTYNLTDIQEISPGFYVNQVINEVFYDNIFNKTTFPYQPIGGGGGNTPEEKQNIYVSLRELINNSIFNGEAVQGTIEYNIATLIALICCIAMILLPFLACWGIVKMIFRR